MQHLFSKYWMKTCGLALAMAAISSAGCAEKKTNSYQGYVEGEFVYVSSSQAGRLDRLMVARGDRVSAGAPLFALESQNEAAAERQARQQLGAAEAQFQDLRTGKRQQELEVIRAQLGQAVARNKTAAAQLVRDQSQYQAGGIALAQLEQSRAEADADAERVRELTSQLSVAELPARSEQIRAQSASVAAARATLDQSAWKLNQKAVAATKAGLVFDTIFREGEWVQAGTPVVRLLPPENVKVRFFIPETVLGALPVGRKIALYCDGCPNEIPAKVTYVSAESEYTPPIIYSNETRSKLVYMVEARPDGTTPSSLHPGQPVEVKLR